MMNRRKFFTSIAAASAVALLPALRAKPAVAKFKAAFAIGKPTYLGFDPGIAEGSVLCVKSVGRASDGAMRIVVDYVTKEEQRATSSCDIGDGVMIPAGARIESISMHVDTASGNPTISIGS